LDAALTGNPSKSTAIVQSEPLTLQFDGVTQLGIDGFAEGELALSIPSFGGLAAWLGFRQQLQDGAFPIKIDGRLSASAGKWQIADALIEAGSNSGNGLIVLQPGDNDGAKPALNGTLDFDALDIGALENLVQVFMPGFVVSPQSNLASIDVRVSAKTARYHALEIGTVAASLKLADGTSTIDLNNAEAFGGTLQLAFRRTSQPQLSTEMRVLADSIDTNRIATLDPALLLLPRGTATISAILSGPGSTIDAFFAQANGPIKLRMADGVMQGFDGAAAVNLVSEGKSGELSLSPLATTRFSDLNAEARLSRGNLQIDALRVTQGNHAIKLAGTMLINGESLALSGSIAKPGDDPKDQIPVLLGGKISAPVISALTAPSLPLSAAPIEPVAP
jgi:AsmA protein